MPTNSKSHSSLLGHFDEAFGSFIGVGDEEAENLLTDRGNRGGRARLSATELLLAQQEIIVAVWSSSLIALPLCAGQSIAAAFEELNLNYTFGACYGTRLFEDGAKVALKKGDAKLSVEWSTNTENLK